MMKLQDWIMTREIFADKEYLSDGTTAICKSEIDTWKHTSNLIKIIENLNTKTFENLLAYVPYEKGESISLPNSVFLGSNKRLFFVIEHNGEKIPFDYSKVSQVFNYTYAKYVTLCKVDEQQYILKFFGSDDCFCGCVSSCTKIKHEDELLQYSD